MRGLGLDFRIEAADIDETEHPGEAPNALVCRLSREKAEVVARRYPEAAVLAADTVVVLDGVILGKPADAADAGRMLRRLRGRVHQVYTAVSVACETGLAGECCRSDVWMRDYRNAEIAAYVATGDPLDKAGAYAIQHPAFSPVERWAGCYASIMGLPLGLAARLLGHAGVAVPNDVIDVCEQSSGAGQCCLRKNPPGC